jgi:head-tail adaptor
MKRTASSGIRRQLVTVRHAGPSVPDGDGGWTPGDPIEAVPPTWHVSVKRATQVELERLAAGTVISTATHIVIGPYRPDITRTSQVLLHGRRVLQVADLQSVEERNQELVCICIEQVTATPYVTPLVPAGVAP